MVAIKILLLSSVLLIAYTSRALEAGNAEKQPVFLVCPHAHGYDSMSLYVEVDKNDKSKILALGLENLKGQNSKDSSYEAVLRAQDDPKVRREQLGTLRAADFGRGQIAVRKDDAMRISVTPVGKDLRLSLSMRISLNGRFNIGGKDSNNRDVLLRYDANAKKWYACADHLRDTDGRETAQGGCQRVSGIAFPVTGTGIYRVVVVTDSGDTIVAMDR